MERINQKKEEQLDEYIREKKWKLALKLIETRQKKGDKSDSLLIRKIIVLLSFRDDVRIEQGKKELKALQLRKPPIADQQALKRLDLFLAGRKDRDDFANNLWAAAGPTSQDEGFLSTWFQLKFDQGRWEAAQKAAQTWQKIFSKQRLPFFLWILSSHLVSIAPGVSDMNRQVAQGFAYKLLAKAATEVSVRKSENEEILSPPRALRTEQDLLLLVEVYAAQLKYLEALKILEDPRTGLLSHLCQNKWDIVRRMIELYELSGKWKCQWDVCSAILVNARPDIFDKMTDDSTKFDFGGLGDDWAVWNGLVTACGKLSANAGDGAETYVDRTNTIIEQFCKDDKSRNAVLANVKLHSVRAEVNANHQKPLVSICKEFFSRFCNKVTCFQDLRPYVPVLGGDDQAELLQSMRSYLQNKRPAANADVIKKLHWITAETNVMKFEYHFAISRDDNGQLGDLLPAFVCNCLRLYKISLHYDFKLPPSDRLPGDDAAILAIMALVRMYRLKHTNPSWASCLLRCVTILKVAKDKSPHNYDMLLILIRIYLYLGAGSLALGLWTELSVKNVQHLTVSWMLFTRLSTLHPYPVTVFGIDRKMIKIDPLEETLNALTWHRRASTLNSHSMDDFRANGQWMMELDSLEAKSALENGYSRLMLLGESSRMRRFRQPGYQIDEDSTVHVRLLSRTKDTRDSTAFPDYEAHGQTKFWRLCPSVEVAGSATTNEKWLAANLRQALVWDGLRGISNSIVEWTDLETFAQSFDQQADAASDIEQVLFNIGALIQRGLDELHPQAAKSTILSDSIGKILLQVNALSDEAIQHKIFAQDSSPRTHFGADLHAKYCMLEICQFAGKFVNSVRNANRAEFWMEKMLADLQTGCKKIAANVWKSAVDLRADVGNETYVNDLCQKCGEMDEVGRELNGLLKIRGVGSSDSDYLRSVITMLQQSWLDAYEGVVRTKVID